MCLKLEIKISFSHHNSVHQLCQIFLSALRYHGGGEARWVDVGVPGVHGDLARVRPRLHLHDRHCDRGQPQEASEEGGQEVQGSRAEGPLQQDFARAARHEGAGQVSSAMGDISPLLIPVGTCVIFSHFLFKEGAVFLSEILL